MNYKITEVAEEIDELEEKFEEYESLFEWEEIAQKVFKYPERRLKAWDMEEAEENYDEVKQRIIDLKKYYKDETGEDYDTRRME